MVRCYDRASHGACNGRIGLFFGSDHATSKDGVTAPPAEWEFAHRMEPEWLRVLAGAGPYARGTSYFEDGRVTNLVAHRGRITDTVEGTHPYHVELRATPRLLEGSCNCPASEGFEFCKHCVAVALAFQANKRELAALA